MDRTRRDLLMAAGLLSTGLSGRLDGESDAHRIAWSGWEPLSPVQGGGGSSGGSGAVTSDPEAVLDDLARSDPEVDEETLATLVDGITAFTTDLHRELVAANPDANLFSSPLSVSTAFSLVWAGVGGETADEIAGAFHYSLGPDDHHRAFNRLDRDLQSRTDPDAEGDLVLSVANALWGQAGYPFRKSYLETVGTHYGAGLRTVDFRESPESARQRINDWVAEETEGRIEDLLPQGSIDDLTRFVLTNAIHLDADWAAPFDGDRTEPHEFTGLDGEAVELPTMFQESQFPYAAWEGHQAVELPYAGEEMSMVVILPAAGEFESFEADLDADRLGEVTGRLSAREGTVGLPRFTFDAKFSLVEVLSNLGVEDVFDPDTADFSPMVDREATDEPLFVSDVFHEAFVAVDEEGTEATGATGAIGGTTSVGGPEPFEMTVDHPFLFAIRDRPTDAVLFLGRVVDPDTLEDPTEE